MNPLNKKNMRLARGFTLMEVLVATTLFSLVLTMIFSALYTGSRAWHAGELQVETNDQYRIGLGFIRKYLAQATPLTQIDGRERRLLFKGDSHALHFISALPAHTGGSSHHLLTLVVEDNDNSSALMLLYRPVTPDIELEANLFDNETESIALLPEIDNIEMSYFGQEQPDSDPNWFDRWDNDEALPDIIRIQLTAKDERHAIPELLIPLRVTNVRGMNQFVINKNNITPQRTNNTNGDRQI